MLCARSIKYHSHCIWLCVCVLIEWRRPVMITYWIFPLCTLYSASSSVNTWTHLSTWCTTPGSKCSRRNAYRLERIQIRNGNSQRCPGAPAPVFWEQKKTYENFSKKCEKNHARTWPWSAPSWKISHQNIIVCALGKNDKILTRNSKFRISHAVRNLAFSPRSHTMTFRCEIFHGDADHGQVRAWFFSHFFVKFSKKNLLPKKSEAGEPGHRFEFPQNKLI